jgi:hypothetical protein
MGTSLWEGPTLMSFSAQKIAQKTRFPPKTKTNVVNSLFVAKMALLSYYTLAINKYTCW